MEMMLLNSGQLMVRNFVELWEYMMNVVRNVVTVEKLYRKIQFVGDESTTSVPKYAVMEKFIKKTREQPVVARTRTTRKYKSVAIIVPLQNSSAKKAGTGDALILHIWKQYVIQTILQT